MSSDSDKSRLAGTHPSILGCRPIPEVLLFYPIAPGDQTTNAYALFTALTKWNLAVDRIVGGHGAISPFRDLAKLMVEKPNPIKL